MKNIRYWDLLYNQALNLASNPNIITLKELIYCYEQDKESCLFLSNDLPRLYEIPYIRKLMDIFIYKSLNDPTSYVLFSNLDEKGNYDFFSLIFISSNISINISISETFIHELVHYVLNKIFINYANPYYPNDPQNTKLFEDAERNSIINILKDSDPNFHDLNQSMSSWSLGEILCNKLNDTDNLYKSIRLIYTLYTEEENHKEFIARFYQNIAINNQKVIKALEPINTYIDHVLNPIVENYILSTKQEATSDKRSDYKIYQTIIENDDIVNIDLEIQKYKDDNVSPVYCYPTIFAIETDRLQPIESLIKFYDINYQNIFGSTALHYAGRAGKLKAIDLLLKHNADVNIINLYNSTPVHYAITNNETNAVELLLKHSVKVNKNNISCKGSEIFEFLIKNYPVIYMDIINDCIDINKSKYFAIDYTADLV
jgi:hypothetical protein